MAAPLAERLRPRTLDEVIGQPHLLGPGRPLRRVIEADLARSMILWGPPGTGKTTLARLIATHTHAGFATLSAVLAGVKDIRAAAQAAEALRAESGTRTVLFVDEVHRFTRTQQDALLPHLEDGTLGFIGATTENPSFALSGAMLSRARVYVLKPLSATHLDELLTRALADPRGYGGSSISWQGNARERLVALADGDARRLCNLLESALDIAPERDGAQQVDAGVVEALEGGAYRRFDRGGDLFYDQISALHKAVRGSAPDAALYWLARMLDGGCDPRFVARRITRMASEDIGNADPRALELAIAAWESFTRLGSPEGELALAQAVLYLACVPKSNAVYTAWQAAQADARSHGSLEPPLHLRNAPTRLMRDLGHGAGYRYAHDEADGYAAGVNYFPDGMAPGHYYHPGERGLERRIAEHLANLRARDPAPPKP